jgi:antimicrobial peptide system SdpB family protein
LKPYSLNVARWISIGILVLVISGWRPRITGILHWWVAFSLNTSSIVLDGGDQVANVLCLLLVPITLLDSRVSHWKNPEKTDAFNPYTLIFANATMLLIRLQVAIIYFHAAVGKFKIDEWMDGTALYYFMSDPLFAGTPDFVLKVFKFPFIMTSITWFTLILETVLILGLVIPKSKRVYLFVPALIFHMAIIVVFGLISFGCSMIAALILYLRPWDQYFNYKGLGVMSRLRMKTL